MSFYDATVPALPANSRQPFRPAHQGRGALQGEEHPARGAARFAALSGHAAAVQADPARLRFRRQGLRPRHPQRGAATPDTEKTFEELRQRLAKTIDYVKSFKPAQFEGADTKDVTFPIGPDKTMTMKGQQFISTSRFPHFYFHAAIAHGILRHNGVEIGKRDFMGVN